MDDETIAMAILHFFDWFRIRRSSIERLSRVTMPPGMEELPLNLLPDQAVLISAGIDSLAGRWGRLYRPSLNRHAPQRMGEFLIQHSRSEIWRRLSLPDLQRRAHKNDRQVDYRPLITSLNAIPPCVPIGAIRSWQQDPEIGTLLANPAVKASAAHVRWSSSTETLESWLRKSRYGELFYSKYRCAWIHEFQSEKHVGSESFVDSDVPHYDNLHRRPNRLIFPLVFMLQTYAEVIKNFEKACEIDRRNPIPSD